jgi:hypothetical protein
MISDPSGTATSHRTDPTTGLPSGTRGEFLNDPPLRSGGPQAPAGDPGQQAAGTASQRQSPGSPAATPADSPMTQYTARAVGIVLIIGVLVTALLGGAFLILNLGLLSKRREDRIGERTPSDLGILKSQFWPQEPDDHRVLPAMEDEEEGIQEQFHQQATEPRNQGEPPREPKPLRKIS